MSILHRFVTHLFLCRKSHTMALLYNTGALSTQFGTNDTTKGNLGAGRVLWNIDWRNSVESAMEKQSQLFWQNKGNESQPRFYFAILFLPFISWKSAPIKWGGQCLFVFILTQYDCSQTHKFGTISIRLYNIIRSPYEPRMSECLIYLDA